MYHSDPELNNEPSERQRLGDLLRMRPYQIDPNDPVCADRIDRVEESIRNHDADERRSHLNPEPRSSEQRAISVRASAQSGISITTDDMPPDFNEPLLLRSTNPIPSEGVD